MVTKISPRFGFRYNFHNQGVAVARKKHVKFGEGKRWNTKKPQIKFTNARISCLEFGLKSNNFY